MRRLGRLASAAPDLALGCTFLLTWIAPQLVGSGKATYAAQLMTLEFVVVHSAVIVGHMGMRSTSRVVNGAWILGLSAFIDVRHPDRPRLERSLAALFVLGAHREPADDARWLQRDG